MIFVDCFENDRWRVLANTSPNLCAQDLLPHDLAWKEVWKEPSVSKEKTAATGDLAAKSARTEVKSNQPNERELEAADSGALSKTQGEDSRANEEESPVGISIRAVDIQQWISKGGWWSFRGSRKEIAA